MLALPACRSVGGPENTALPRERFLLSYDGDKRFAPTDSAAYTRMLSGGDLGSSCAQQPFTGVILLALQAQSGRWFASWEAMAQREGPANGEDWEAYLAALFRAGGVLDHLQRGAAGAGGARPVDVVVMLPYIEPNVTTFAFGGERFRIISQQTRANPYRAYLARLTDAELWRSRYPNLRLTGVYWLHETVWAIDIAFVREVARLVHQVKLQFLWIPYYGAGNAENWRELGFDRAWLQPNYFFNPEISRHRLRKAAAIAWRAGMGLEIEFDARLFTDPRFRDRLQPYLDLVRAERTPSIAVYEGAGALSTMLDDTSPQTRALADSLITTLCSAP